MKLNVEIKILQVKQWKTNLRYARVPGRACTQERSLGGGREIVSLSEGGTIINFVSHCT